MKLRYLVLLFSISLLLLTCSTTKKQSHPFTTDVYLTGRITPVVVKKDTTYIDGSRMKRIPASVYIRYGMQHMPEKIILFNPDNGISSYTYDRMIDTLAKSGFMVVVAHHVIPNNSPLLRIQDINQLRRQLWEDDVKDILFLYNKIQKDYNWQWMDYKHPVLIGNLNGGDVAMLMASEHPDFAKIVIAIDNNHMPIPLTLSPKIFSIRSSDQPADPGVLPPEDELKRFYIKIVKVNITHNDMGGMGNVEQLDEINSMIVRYLRRND